jgi:hypothetical protein
MLEWIIWLTGCNIAQFSRPSQQRLLYVRIQYFDAVIDDSRKLVEVIAGYLKAKLSEFLS